ncbi:L-rhamnose mutarotase [Hufsiella ginkgonis]|uniref:L-rhamnose mutarotase n=1 Tax=Hufsiella ginkgonis TaxID=2695274 RepID=A0A7K1XVU3_9SPHI|nr:L-rhamnose mutarotase [Hufsiella ginkgonis]MXV14928.1 L-rhamnose mutarotase [Hufsiella ginkgonis]
MKRYCLALDLVDDPALIAEYEDYHQAIWPEIRKSILDAGITNMEIYRIATRLFMIMDTDETFDPVRKQEADAANPSVAEWEQLMWKYQQALPQAKSGEKWLMMDKIFQL